MLKSHFSPSHFFSDEEVQVVQHIISPKDFIPLLGDPLGYFYISWKNPSLVRVIPPAQGWTFANHSFLGSAYQEEILRICAEFKSLEKN